MHVHMYVHRMCTCARCPASRLSFAFLTLRARTYTHDSTLSRSCSVRRFVDLAPAGCNSLVTPGVSLPVASRRDKNPPDVRRYGHTVGGRPLLCATLRIGASHETFRWNWVRGGEGYLWFVGWLWDADCMNRERRDCGKIGRIETTRGNFVFLYFLSLFRYFWISGLSYI